MDSKKLKVAHDTFCWRCCTKDTGLKCNRCVRSFHERCLSETEHAPNDDDNDWLCPVCVMLISIKNTDKPEDLKMLPLILNRVLEDKVFGTFKCPKKCSKPGQFEHIVNPIDLQSINNRIDTFSSFTEFIIDVEWIAHNCVTSYSDQSEKTKTARMMVDFLSGEIESVKKCAECYSNANLFPDKWFAMACEKPHLIVWAKMKGFNYWPAKLMSIDGQLINVRFFGDHTHANVPATSCFLYSEKSPNKTRNSSQMYKNAMKEAFIYIESIQQKFGEFHAEKMPVKFNPSSHNKYILNMIPGYEKLHGTETIVTLSESDDYEDEFEEERFNQDKPEEQDSGLDPYNIYEDSQFGETPEMQENDKSSIDNAIQCLEMEVTLHRIDSPADGKEHNLKRKQTTPINESSSKKTGRLSNEDRKDVIQVDDIAVFENIDGQIEAEYIQLGDAMEVNAFSNDSNDVEIVIEADQSAETNEKANVNEAIDNQSVAVNYPTNNENKSWKEFASKIIAQTKLAMENGFDMFTEFVENEMALARADDQQKLVEMKFALNSAIEEKYQLKQANGQLQQKFDQTEELNAKLQENLDQMEELMTKLQQNNDHLQHELEQFKDKRRCKACGKTEDDVFNCSNECFENYIKKITNESLK